MRQVALATAAIGALGVVLATTSARGEGGGRILMTALMILLGPISGWILAWLSGHVSHALGMLLPTTLLCVLSLAAYLRWRSAIALAVALLLWVTTGYLFGTSI